MLYYVFALIFSRIAYSPQWYYAHSESVAIMEMGPLIDSACTDGFLWVDGESIDVIKGDEIKGAVKFPCAQKKILSLGAHLLVFASYECKKPTITLAMKSFECYYRNGDSLSFDSRCLNINLVKKYCKDQPKSKGCLLACRALERENGDSSCFMRYSK